MVSLAYTLEPNYPKRPFPQARALARDDPPSPLFCSLTSDLSQERRAQMLLMLGP